MPYTAVYVETADAAVLGFVAEVPGARATAPTIEEAREKLRAVLKATLEANRQCCFQSAEGMRRLRAESIHEIP